MKVKIEIDTESDSVKVEKSSQSNERAEARRAKGSNEIYQKLMDMSEVIPAKAEKPAGWVND